MLSFALWNWPPVNWREGGGKCQHQKCISFGSQVFGVILVIATGECPPGAQGLSATSALFLAKETSRNFGDRNRSRIKTCVHLCGAVSLKRVHLTAVTPARVPARIRYGRIHRIQKTWRVNGAKTSVPWHGERYTRVHDSKGTFSTKGRHVATNLFNRNLKLNYFIHYPARELADSARADWRPIDCRCPVCPSLGIPKTSIVESGLGGNARLDSPENARTGPILVGARYSAGYRDYRYVQRAYAIWTKHRNEPEPEL